MNPFLRRLSFMFREGRFDRDMDDEMRFHLDMKQGEYEKSGMTPEEAHRAAMLRFGNPLLLRESSRQMWAFAWLETLVQDIRYALRVLRRAPGFTITVVATMALGIGATTAIFSVVNAVLLKPLPFSEPDRILALTTEEQGSVSGQIFWHTRERARSFEGIAAQGSGTGWNLMAGSEAEYVDGLSVSEGYFAVLGFRPLLGHEFTREQDRPGGTRGVILSEQLWRRRFGARGDILGQTVYLGNAPYPVVGVMPAGVRTIPQADLWTPLRVSPQDNTWNYRVLGRLRPGVEATGAQSEFGTLWPMLASDLRLGNDGSRRVINWMPYHMVVAGDKREPLLILLGAVGFVLLIACANVAGLQLARSTSRRRELTARAALGGSVRRLVQQVLIESILLGVAGGAIGLLLSTWGMRSVLALAPTGLAFGQTVGIEWTVLAVALALSVLTGVFFGLVPALDAARIDPRAVLCDMGGRHTAGRRTIWLRRIFTVIEVTLAVVLLIGAGLLMRTFVNLRSVELGFDSHNVLTGQMSLRGWTPGRNDGFVAFVEGALYRIRRLPGVEAAAVGNNVPVERGLNLPLAPPPGSLVQGVRAIDWRYVTPEYFSVFRIPLRAGRPFDERDVARGAPVALVNEAFVRAYFGNASPIGKSISLVAGVGNDPVREIVGVVADVRTAPGAGWSSGRNALAASAAPIIYVPVAQVPDALLAMVHSVYRVSWAVRVRTMNPNLIPAIQSIVREAQPGLPFVRFLTMEDVVGQSIQTERFHLTLIAIFAAVAMTLAAIGIYGLVAYNVSQRTKEIGVRMALGAEPRGIFGQFVRESLVLAFVGMVLGLSGAAALSQTLQSFVWGVKPLDPMTFIVVSTVLMAMAVGASLLPALRATRVNPTEALRYE